MDQRLELCNIRRSFGGLVAVDGLSLAVPAGRIFGFVGRNGAGKTTTMRIVCGLLAADHGRVLWNGRPIDMDARRGIGYMPEERGLYPKMRVGEQLAYLAVLHGATHDEARVAARAWLERFELGDRERDRVETLSHGNQQRVQLAAALVHNPGLLILDEPFAGLDPIATDAMSDVLRQQAARGVPVLLSSHQLELVERLCTAVAILDRGRLVASGEVEELRSHGSRLLRVDVQGAPGEWGDGIAGAEVVERGGGRTVFKLAPGADTQRILDIARRAGVVSHFSVLRPSLAELYREVVSS